MLQIICALLLIVLPFGCADKTPLSNDTLVSIPPAKGSQKTDEILPPVGAADAPREGMLDAPTPMASPVPAVSGEGIAAPGVPSVADISLADEAYAGSEGGLSGDMLTAGSFDDALNLDVFSEYWKDTTLSSAGISQLEQPNWHNLIPKKEEHSFETLDLNFVIDVTGSMGDELSYIRSEIDGIASEVALKFPDVKQRYGMIVYRDNGDEFVTRKYDFTDDLQVFQNNLNQQKSDGGGDYPEAMDEALSLSTSFQWGSDNSSKVLFLIADAPPHDTQIKKTFDAVFNLKEKGVHIYPIAASGVADLAESVMRTSALLTGGQYIFLTDDSGIGNSHAEPRIPCYHVEKLKDVMVRVISDELSGQRSEPDPNKLIRTVGNPVKGVCASGQ